MPKYSYTAKSQPYKSILGEIEAESEQDAINKLTRRGYFPLFIQLHDLSQEKRGVIYFHKTSGKDIVLFTTQLVSLIESGVNILKSLGIICEQTPNKYLKEVVSDIASKIKAGKSLSEALTHYPRLFSNLYVAMVHSGEAGGTLEQTLKALAEFLEKEDEFKNSLRAALVYPAFIFSISAFTVLVLLGFVIPRLVTMFEDMGQILPLPTRILISISTFFRSYWWCILITFGIMLFLLRRTLASEQGRLLWDKGKLKLKIFGEIILKTEISRFARTLSLLLSSGTAVVYSLDTAISVVENKSLKLELQKIKDQVSGGFSLSQGFKNSKLFPVFVTNIVTVGEETGTLEKSLVRIADGYEKDVDRSLKTLTRLLEPIIILVMGVIVGFIVLAMLLPIFQINLIVK